MHVQVLVGVGPTGVWGSIGPRVRQRLRPHAPFRMRIHTHTRTHEQERRRGGAQHELQCACCRAWYGSHKRTRGS